MLSHVGKLYAKILESRIKPIIEPQLNIAQFGFRKGKSCTDALFTLRQLSENTIEYDKQLNLAFIDQEKAFDRINRNKLWAILSEYGIQGQLLDNIRALYQKCSSVVRTSDGLTDEFQLSSGVRQGCVLSPILFNIYIDRITQESMTDNNVDNNNNLINELLFADDQSIIYDNEHKLQQHINALQATCEKYNMKINTSKTEVMTISRTTGQLNIHVNNVKIQQTPEFKYLGSIFTEDGKMDREIETRCQKANAVTYQLSPLLKHPSINMTVKRQLINSIFTPTLCYQCQTCLLYTSPSPRDTR